MQIDGCLHSRRILFDRCGVRHAAETQGKRQSPIFGDGGWPAVFYLADTAWELFHRLTREEAVHYLDNRAALGYNAVQAVAIAELEGIETPNAYGHKPFMPGKGAKPAIVEGKDNDY